MPNYYLSVLYKHIIQVENKNLGLKVGGHKHTIGPPSQKSGGAHAPLAPPLPTPVHVIVFKNSDLHMTCIWRPPLYGGHFCQVPRVATIDRFDCIYKIYI